LNIHFLKVQLAAAFGGAMAPHQTTNPPSVLRRSGLAVSPSSSHLLPVSLLLSLDPGRGPHTTRAVSVRWM